MAELQLAQTETVSYFRILPNLPALGTKAWHYTYSNWEGDKEGEEGRRREISSEKSSFVLLNHY